MVSLFLFKIYLVQTSRYKTPHNNRNKLIFDIRILFVLAIQQCCQRRQHRNGCNHIQQKHESQQDAHINLKLQIREDPGEYSDTECQPGEEHRVTRHVECLFVGITYRHPQIQLFMQPVEDIDTVVDAYSNSKRNDGQSGHFEPNTKDTHQGVCQCRDKPEIRTIHTVARNERNVSRHSVIMAV